MVTGEEKKKFISYLKLSIEDGSFQKIILGKYRGGDSEFQNIFINLLETKDGEKLSFKLRYKTKDIIKNYDFEKGINLIDEITGKDFFSAALFTTSQDYNLDYSKKRIPKLHIKKPSLITKEIFQHNKVKSRFVKPDALYFHLLGITTPDGKIKSDKYDKFRQVDKFIEIMDSLFQSSDLKNKNEIKILDMGSGKSYMTFALYDYFTNTLKKSTFIKGIEQRTDLVGLSNEVAGKCSFAHLQFLNESINTVNELRADIVVALHACDTATDDAIEKAIKSRAVIIILAPCCHKYVRKKMKSQEVLGEIFKHGILMERLAISVTDGLRALVLEYFGYETKVFEFISQEHTAKNTMITAVKRKQINLEKLTEIKAIKKEYQMEDFYLDRKLIEMDCKN